MEGLFTTVTNVNFDDGALLETKHLIFNSINRA